MMLIEKTTVPNAALPVEDFKTHLRLGTSFEQDDSQDDMLAGFLRAALAAIEARTGKVLIARTFEWTLNRWSSRDQQGFPVAPVIAVTRLFIVTRAGEAQEVEPGFFWLERDAQRPRIRAVGAQLPLIPQGGNALVEFEAGFGPIWADLPPDLKQAVLLLAAHFYEYRNETSLSEGCMPFGVSSLIERFRDFRMGPGAMR